MSLFDSLGQPQSQQQQFDPRQEMQSLRANPTAYLKQRGFTIPAGMTDPSQITQHLLRSGQVGNPRYQMALRMIQGMRK